MPRVEKPPHRLEPGEYALCDYTEGRKVWFCCTPNGLLGNLQKHDVTEHEDGTITVSPSILVRRGAEGEDWHGYLERGTWREV